MEKSNYSQLLSFAEGSTCMECGASFVVFASVNNGVFLCQDCGELHKQLPEAISRVKSIHNETWTTSDIDLMVNGGNERIWDAFKYYGMPKDAAFDFKYKTRVGYYYRSMLAGLAKGEDLGNPPSLNEGLSLVNEQTDTEHDSKAPDDFWEGVDYYGNKGVEYTKKTFKEVKETVTDAEWQNKVKEGAIQTGMKIEKTLAETADEAKRLYLNKKQQVEEEGLLKFVKSEGNKAITFTKKGLSGVFGFISKHLTDEPQEEKKGPLINLNKESIVLEKKEPVVLNDPEPVVLNDPEPQVLDNDSPELGKKAFGKSERSNNQTKEGTSAQRDEVLIQNEFDLGH